MGVIIAHYVQHHHNKPAVSTLDDRAEGAKEFFRIITPLLEQLYPIVDSYGAKTGRSPACRRLYHIFLILSLDFWKVTLDDVREVVNQ